VKLRFGHHGAAGVTAIPPGVGSSSGPARFLSSSLRALLALGVCAAWLAASPVDARELHWKSLEVGATLDGQGVLHVVERQHMVFTGDWNGGERKFDLRPGQEIELRAMTRIDPATGARRAMREGSLGGVDRYAWFSDRLLRWRARLPDDPPFDNTEIVYDIAYSLYGALVETGDGYALNHDFAFADRTGVIASIVVTLRVDPAWRADGPREQVFRGGPLAPGAGYVVRTPLEWSGAGRPALQRTSPGQARLLLALAGVPLVLVVLLLASEWSRGRFAPLTPEAALHRAWLEGNLLRHPAELIGAVWDRGVGADEVAATIARLAGESKLETRVDGEKELHMRLKVDRNTLAGHERALVDGFFFGGRSETSTSDVKRHYKSKGFNPTLLIQPTLEAQAQELVGPPAQNKRLPLWLPTLVAFVWAVYLFWTAEPATAEGRVPRFVGILLPMLVLAGIASSIAAFWRARLDRGPWSVIRFLIPGGLMLAFAAGVVIGFRDVPMLSRAFRSGFSFDVRLGATLLALALFNSMINQARSRERAPGIAFRKRLASVRRYFQEELDKPQPALRNEWFPYVIAFGLDNDAQDWFKAYGGQSASDSNRPWSLSPSSSSSGGGSSSGSSSSSSAGSGWTGGGGSFGGAGATVAWAAAAGSLAAGVASPSSGSSSGGGGGGGGGSSSGGGGGGGW
jgi:uncharacterized membrane protein YgcG